MNNEGWGEKSLSSNFWFLAKEVFEEGINGSKNFSRSVHHKKIIITELVNENVNFGPIFSAHICELTGITAEFFSIL